MVPGLVNTYRGKEMDDSSGQGTFHEQDIQKGEVPDGARFCFVLEKLDAKSFKFAKPIQVMLTTLILKRFDLFLFFCLCL